MGTKKKKFEATRKNCKNDSNALRNKRRKMREIGKERAGKRDGEEN